jgi:hypothetical protein
MGPLYLGEGATPSYLQVLQSTCYHIIVIQTSFEALCVRPGVMHFRVLNSSQHVSPLTWGVSKLEFKVDVQA